LGSAKPRSRAISLGEERMPKPIFPPAHEHSIKHAAAEINHRLGSLDKKRRPGHTRGRHAGCWTENSTIISRCGVADRSALRQHERQRGVAPERTSCWVGQGGQKAPVHPNDHVNMSQSSKRCFPTAMHIAAVEEITHRLLLRWRTCRRRWREKKQRMFAHIVKIGRPPQGRNPLTWG